MAVGFRVVRIWSELLPGARYEAPHPPRLLPLPGLPFLCTHPISTVLLDPSWAGPTGEAGALGCVPCFRSGACSPAWSGPLPSQAVSWAPLWPGLKAALAQAGAPQVPGWRGGACVHCVDRTAASPELSTASRASTVARLATPITWVQAEGERGAGSSGDTLLWANNYFATVCFWLGLALF